MIIFASSLGKVLLPIVLAALLFLWERRKHCTKIIIALSMCVLVIAAYASFRISLHVPQLTDEITLTALGVNGAEAEADNVFIEKFVIDGESREVDQVVSGKWFWAGGSYCWRNETDPRQPEGTTRAVVLGVPVGWNRSIVFETGEEQGQVELEIDGKTQVVDTSLVRRVSLGSSRTSDLIWNQLRRAGVYAAVLIVCACVILVAAAHWERLCVWSKKNWWHLVCGGIALAQFIVAVHYSGIDGFWSDEIFEIGYQVQSQNILERAFADVGQRPLFEAFFWLWYPIAPYGEKWLLLPMELVTAVGIYFTALCAKQCKDEIAGIFAAVFCALSGMLLEQCSFEIRSYAFFYCFSALLLLCYFRRLRHIGHETNRDILLMSIVMPLFALQHGHGPFYCIALFCVDIFLYFRERIKLKCIIPYLVGAVSYIPTLILSFRFLTGEENHSWMTMPTPIGIINLINYFCNDKVVTPILLLAGIAYAVSSFKFKHGTTNPYGVPGGGRLRLIISAMVIYIAIAYVHGRRHPLETLWVDRYFLSLMPHFAIMIGTGVSSLCTIFTRGAAIRFERQYFAILTVLLLIYSSLPSMSSDAHKIKAPFREAANWLYEQRDYIYNDDTIVISPYQTGWISGWEEYYFTKQGKRDPIKVVNQSTVTPEDLKQYNRIYLVNIRKTTAYMQTLLVDDFERISNDSTVKIMTYVRAEPETEVTENE